MSFKKDFLNALEDEKVLRKIKSILSINTNNEEVEKYKRKYKEYKKKYDELNEKSQNIEKQVKDIIKKNTVKVLSLEEENNNLCKNLEKIKIEQKNVIDDLNEKNNEIKVLRKNIESIEDEKNTIKKDVENFRRSYADIEKYYGLYLKLSDKLKSELKNILNCENAQLFIAWGTQWANITALFETISYNFNNYSKDDLDKIIAVFDYFFDLYKNVNNAYERLETKIGEKYDYEYHVKIGESSSSETIKEVVLLGYKRISDGKIMQKSFVRV